ncbi:MAG: tetratricopeptide repeat protein [Proteobacteria bacterium]|nr:tetratricopeptide repeat protein [Pseudomonadota bacterium]
MAKESKKPGKMAARFYASSSSLDQSSRIRGLAVLLVVGLGFSYAFEQGWLPEVKKDELGRNPSNQNDVSVEAKSGNEASKVTLLATSKSDPKTPVPKGQNVDSLTTEAATPSVLERVRALTDSGEMAAAVALLEESLRAEPNSVSLLMELGIISMLDLKDSERARRIFERVVALDPLQRGALNELMVIYDEQGRIAEGLDYLQARLLTAGDPSEIQYVYAKLLTKSGRMAEAYDSFEAAASIKLDLADTALGLGKYERAISAIESALRLQENELARAKERQADSVDFVEDRITSTKIIYIRALLRAGRVAEAAGALDGIGAKEDNPMVASVRREVSIAARL